MPILVINLSWFSLAPAVWSHLVGTVLSEYVVNSLILACGVGLGSFTIGTSLAWCIVRYQFVGRGVLRWIVLLPLAMPAYIIAYTYSGLLDYSGSVQTAIRETFSLGYGDYWFPNVQTLPGAILLLSFVLYPYVYILARTAFREQSRSLELAHTSFGRTRTQYFWKVALPLARPAIFAGTALTMMEALADFGAVQYLGIPTFTTGIYRTWFGMGEPAAASQLSSLLCILVLIVLILEKRSRKAFNLLVNKQVDHTKRIVVKPMASVGLLLLCALPFCLGFLLPSFQLMIWAVDAISVDVLIQYSELAFNSFLLASVGGFIIALLAVYLCYAHRTVSSRFTAAQNRFMGLGYAIPGTVVAVGILIPLGWLDLSINALSILWFNTSTGLIFSGTIFALILAYTVRFLGVALHNIEAGLGRITSSMDETAMSFGEKKWQTLKRVHLALLKPSLISALLLVFVDIVKELPATLILRPFNFNTLAVKTYELASDERLYEAAIPALAIVTVCLIPIIVLTRALDK